MHCLEKACFCHEVLVSAICLHIMRTQTGHSQEVGGSIGTHRQLFVSLLSVQDALTPYCTG